MAALLSAAFAAIIASAPPEPAAGATASGAGGVFSLPGSTGTPDGKLRLGVGMDWWRGGDFLLPEATTQRTGANLSISAGFLGIIEAYGAISLHSTNLFGDTSRTTLVSYGDSDVGIKLLIPGEGPFSAGLLLQLDLPSGIGSFSLKGAGGRAGVLFGYAANLGPVPFAASAIAAYRMDNSAQLVQGTPATLPAFAFSISDYDVAYGGLTVQAPFKYAAPAAEVIVESPVGRQAALPIGERPVRARMSVGVAQARLPQLPQLALSAAFQFSLTRDGRIEEINLPVPGFSPDPPWTVIAGLSWTFDQPSLPKRAKELEWHEPKASAAPVAPTPAAKTARLTPPPVKNAKEKAVLRVVVTDAKTQLPLAGAWVSFLEGTDVGGTTGPDGRVRVEADAGTLTMAVAKDGYELLTEKVTLVSSEEHELAVQLAEVAPDAVLRGKIVGEDGLPLRAAVLISVAGTLPALPGAGGATPQVFEGTYEIPLQHGSWELNASAPGYRCLPQEIQVQPGGNVSRDLLMRRIAGEPRARNVPDGLELGGSIRFRGAALDPAASPILAEAAAAIKAQPRPLEVVTRVPVADTSGDDAEAVSLSEARARAVVDFLVSKGVSASLLTPRGKGPAKPGQPLLELRALAPKPHAMLQLHQVGGRP